MEAERCLNASEIYDQVTGGPGPRSLGSSHDAARALSDRLTQRAGRVIALRQKVAGGWQGAAGEGAANACQPLADAAADNSVHLMFATDSVSDQMSAFQTAKNSVKPVPPQEPTVTDQDVINVITGQGPTYSTRVAQRAADSQHNVEVFGGYSTSSTANSSRVTQNYSQLEDTGAEVGLAGTDGPGPAKGRGPGRGDENPAVSRGPARAESGPVSVSGGPAPSGAGHPGGGPYQADGGQAAVPPGGHYVPPDSSTRTSSYAPPVQQPPSGYQFGPTGQPFNPLAVGQGGGAGGSFGPLGYLAGGGTGGTGDGTGQGGSGSGGYRGGSGAGNEPGVRGGAGAGARSGAGESGAVRGGNAATGAAGPAGKNGAAMGGGMGGKGGKGEEDKEKKAASYLQEADPDGLFGGSDVRPTPPVIGEIPRRQ